jgi:thiol-disulfide isomerase/thioredoxin
MIESVRAARTLGSLVLTLLAACAEGPAPAYVRISGAAPRLSADVPASRARLVVFWASWCAPCRAETPSLSALAEDPPRDLAIVVFGHDETAEAMRAFFEGPPPSSWNFRPDPEKAAARAFGVEALPASFLVVEGRLAARFAGPRDWNSREMRRLLSRLMDER